MLILIFVRTFDWIPQQGYTPLWEDPVANLAQLIWPALFIGLGFPDGGPAPHDESDNARGDARGLHPHSARQGP